MADFDADRRNNGFEDTSCRHAPKRIIICCDGTWQSSVTSSVNVPSNVTRLARLLTRSGHDDSGKEWQQLVYYDAGIGTGVFKIEALLQGSTGSGFTTNIIEAYNFIVLNYNPGDQIFCIGFSRGAYTARAVAGLVTDIGVVRPRDMQDFPELYETYRAHTDSHLFRQTKAWREWAEGVRLFDPREVDVQEGEVVPEEWKGTEAVKWEKRPHGTPAESTRWVEAVAVFDTVGSLGVPEAEGVAGLLLRVFGRFLPCEKFGFHNVALSPYIRHAFHALALDEHRKPFDATLWHLPLAEGVAAVPTTKKSSAELRKRFESLRGVRATTEEQLTAAWEDLVAAEMAEELNGHVSKLVQVWFPGVHINIGGGNDDLLKKRRGDFEQIALITLHWMISMLSRHLSFLPSAPALANNDRFLQMRPAVDDLIRTGNTSHWLMKKIHANIANTASNTPDLWSDDGLTLKRVLAADALVGWATGPIIDSFTGTMTLGGSRYRTPGGYKESKLQSGKTVKLGKTNEFIHPTVQYRIDHLGRVGYNPTALWGFERKKDHVELEDGSGKVAGYVWEKKDGTKVPEWRIREGDAMERACVASRSSRVWMGKLDKELGVRSAEALALDVKPNVGFQNNGFKPPGSV